MTKIIATAFWIFWGVCVLSLFAHATTTAKHKDSLGVVMQQTNPNTYLAGSVTNVEFAGNRNNYGMVIRVQPLKTYTLYTEDILLCGNPSELFAGHSNPMVLVYRTRSSHMVDGLGCHGLVDVRDVLPEKEFEK
jgi:hypothetical protein